MRAMLLVFGLVLVVGFVGLAGDGSVEWPSHAAPPATDGSVAYGLGEGAILPSWIEKVLQIQCVQFRHLVGTLRYCGYMPFQCPGSWPFGMDETRYYRIERWCQRWLCDPVIGKLCTPYGEPWLAWEGADSETWFVGCGCVPDGSPPFPIRIEPPTR